MTETNPNQTPETPNPQTCLEAYPVAMVEMNEYLMATTLAEVKVFPNDPEAAKSLAKEIRELMWWNRFFLFNWLMLNGVALPAELMADSLHKRVGNQVPDQPAKSFDACALVAAFGVTVGKSSNGGSNTGPGNDSERSS